MKVIKRAALGVLTAAIVGVFAVPASAQTAPGYERFAGCPSVESLQLCMRSDTTGGHIQIGKTNTPINKTMTLSGGLVGPVFPTGDFQFNSKGGLIAPPLNVPGGLTGLTGLSEFIINLITLGANQVQAQAILVGTPVVELGNDTVNVTLPIRVKLINPFLRSTCSIGSAGSPITLHLTSGTTSPPLPNKPITGLVNQFAFDPSPPGVFGSAGNVLVDNSFSAPAASGCDLIGFGLINGLVNARVGLPAAAGTNTAVFSSTTIKAATPNLVYP